VRALYALAISYGLLCGEETVVREPRSQNQVVATDDFVLRLNNLCPSCMIRISSHHHINKSSVVWFSRKCEIIFDETNDEIFKGVFEKFVFLCSGDRFVAHDERQVDMDLIVRKNGAPDPANGMNGLCLCVR